MAGTLQFPNSELKFEPDHSFVSAVRLRCVKYSLGFLPGRGGEHVMFADMSGTHKLIAALLVLCAGCTGSHFSEDLASWQGSHIDEVSSAWGAPYVCEDVGGQQLCSWGNPGLARSQSDAVTELTGQALRPRPACVRMLAVDPSGYVTGWRWRGNHCPDSVTVARVE